MERGPVSWRERGVARKRDSQCPSPSGVALGGRSPSPGLSFLICKVRSLFPSENLRARSVVLGHARLWQGRTPPWDVAGVRTTCHKWEIWQNAAVEHLARGLAQSRSLRGSRGFSLPGTPGDLGHDPSGVGTPSHGLTKGTLGPAPPTPVAPVPLDKGGYIPSG